MHGHDCINKIWSEQTGQVLKRIFKSLAVCRISLCWVSYTEIIISYLFNKLPCFSFNRFHNFVHFYFANLLYQPSLSQETKVTAFFYSENHDLTHWNGVLHKNTEIKNEGCSEEEIYRKAPRKNMAGNDLWGRNL